jgi:hypothetical protein
MLIDRSNEYLTAFESTGVPSGNFTPERRWNVYTSPPREIVHDFAKYGTM